MKDLSLYIHVPFCKRRCAYCTFYHVPYIDDYETAFVSALINEIERSLAERGNVRVPTVFFGGGTPSVLSLASLERIFDAFAPHLTSDAEITVENNPEDVTPDLMRGFMDMGVNRISLGIQSMLPRALRVLKRCGEAVNAAAIECVRDYFDNVSFDLVLGVPDGSLEEVRDTLSRLCEYEPAHFSVYCLEPGGVMGADVESFFDGVDPERSADEYLYVCETLKALGYRHYEVSNFCRPGCESRHNRVYWEGGDYLGVGPAAHSYLGGERYHNEASIEAYVARAGEVARVMEPRGGEARDIERMMLGLRTARGLRLDSLRCGPAVIDDIVASGLAVIDENRIVLTDRGFLLLNEVLLRITPAAAQS